jgi:hypothetical protein
LLYFGSSKRRKKCEGFMWRFALFIVLQGCGFLTFSQVPAANSRPPQSLPLLPQFEMNGPRPSEITPTTRFWISSFSGMKSAQDPIRAAGDVNQLLHAPAMDASTVWASPRHSPASPIAKLEPIPTQWPNAKFEQIPTTWPNLKLQHAAESSSISVPPQ